MDMNHIERTAHWMGGSRDKLSELLGEMHAKLDKVRESYRPKLLAALRELNDAEATLRQEVDVGRELFNKPRTRVFYGIRCGLMKGRGGITWDKDAKVIERIEKQLPDQKDVLIKTKKTLVKKALATLPAETLQRLGVSTKDACDEPFVGYVANDVEKMIQALKGELESVE